MAKLVEKKVEEHKKAANVIAYNNDPELHGSILALQDEVKVYDQEQAAILREQQRQQRQEMRIDRTNKQIEL